MKCLLFFFSWLFECARAQKIVPVDAHLIRPATSDQTSPEAATTGVGGPDIEQAGLEERGGAGLEERRGAEQRGDSELQTSLSSFKPKFDVQVPITLWSRSHAVPNLCSILEEGTQGMSR